MDEPFTFAVVFNGDAHKLDLRIVPGFDAVADHFRSNQKFILIVELAQHLFPSLRD